MTYSVCVKELKQGDLQAGDGVDLGFSPIIVRAHLVTSNPSVPPFHCCITAMGSLLGL